MAGKAIKAIKSLQSFGKTLRQSECRAGGTRSMTIKSIPRKRRVSPSQEAPEDSSTRFLVFSGPCPQVCRVPQKPVRVGRRVSCRYLESRTRAQHKAAHLEFEIQDQHQHQHIHKHHQLHRQKSFGLKKFFSIRSTFGGLQAWITLQPFPNSPTQLFPTLRAEICPSGADSLPALFGGESLWKTNHWKKPEASASSSSVTTSRWRVSFRTSSRVRPRARRSGIVRNRSRFRSSTPRRPRTYPASRRFTRTTASERIS